MNTPIAILGIVEIFSSLSIGIVMLSLTYKILKKIGMSKFKIEHNNTAFSIFIASVLFSVGFMMSAVIQPLISYFRLQNNMNESSIKAFMSFFGTGALFIAIAYTASIIVSLLGVWVYSKLTPIDEFKEIKEGNMGVAIVVSVIIITLTLMTKSGIGLIIESTIPYPDFPPK